MNGGMGDGGGCHPRDNIAMSWLAQERQLSFDLFEATMLCREKQARWLARLLVKEYKGRQFPLIILGACFKPETNLDVGSPAYLVGSFVKEFGMEPIFVDDNLNTSFTEERVIKHPGIFLIGCRHERYATMRFAELSVVIDPHRYIPDSPDGKYEVRRLGEGWKING